MNYLALAKATAPDLALTVLALGILLLDGVWLRSWDTARRAKMLGNLSALGLLGVIVLLQNQFAQCEEHALFADAARILVLDRMTITLKIFVLFLAIGTIVLSISYEFTRHVGEYFCLVMFCTLGINFLITTENLVMFFVALELLSLCLYILTAFHKGLLRSAEASVKYFMFGALSSAFLLFGLSYVLGMTGATGLSGVAVAVKTSLAQTGTTSPLLIVGLLFVIVGIGFKIAVVPFHLWAPDAYEGAPTPVAAFIATGSKVGSFVVGGKILWIGFRGMAGQALITPREIVHGHFSAGWHFTAGWTMILAILATASMIWGNVAAISQRNIKRLLAYSSIAHAGYILVGLLAVNLMGGVAVMNYLVAYSVANLGAFGVVAVLTRAAGGDDIADFNGMVKRSPMLSYLLLIFVLSLAGIPPLAGFFGKFYLFAAAVNADPVHLGLLWLVSVAIITSAISLYYYLILLKHVFVMPPRNPETIVTPGLEKFVLISLAAVVIAMGVYPQVLVGFLSEAFYSNGLILEKAMGLK